MTQGALFTKAIPKQRRKAITLAIVGVGYVGLPLALAFGHAQFTVIGFDKSSRRVQSLSQGNDENLEYDLKYIRGSGVKFTGDEQALKQADVQIVAVPTPIHENKRPDLSFLESASAVVGRNLKRGAVVVFESTVYPGVTEDVCLPIIQKLSGTRCPTDFTIGYSPERINPGDRLHTIDRVAKIVSGCDEKTLDFLSQLYASIVKVGVFQAKSIKVAEAAKLIENTQRDLNIGLMNELSLIFDKMHIRTKDVIDAASTKWNFNRYVPGLVGGHCISVDPHYLLYQSESLGYKPKVILAGRDVNDFMPQFVAQKTLALLAKQGKKPKDCNVLLLGLTFKENLKDVRNSKAKNVIDGLRKSVRGVEAHDPLLTQDDLQHEFGDLRLRDIAKQGFGGIDAVIITVVHDAFKKLDFSRIAREMNQKPVIFDVKSFFSEEKLVKEGFAYDSL